MLNHQLADQYRIFTNAPGEDNAVQAIQRCGVAGNMAGNAVDEGFNRQLRPLMAFVPGFLQRA